MRYVMLGKTGLKVSALGFGCMRLPMKDGKVNRDLSTPLLQRAFELGINFYDTAVMYCNNDSQSALGEAFKGMREKVIISTKNPNSAASADEWWRTLEESLRLLQTDYIDVYHHHGIGWNTFESNLDPAKGGHTKLMLKAKEQGLIRHIAFSFHDAPENLIKLADTGLFENVILQYNLLDQANADAMMHAHEKGMGVVVMGPVGGGRLGLSNDQIVQLTGASSTPEAALRFVWAHPAVNVALSGMENLAMLEQNAAITANTVPFTKDQTDGLNALVTERKQKSGLYCTACRYCMPACPKGVKIPENLDLLNQLLIFGLAEGARERYGWLDVKAIECIACGKCVPLCPQGIQIPEKLREATLALDAGAGTVRVSASLRNPAASGEAQLALEVFNITATARDVLVTLSSATGMTIVNKSASLPALKSMTRKTTTHSVKIPTTEGRQSTAAEVVYDGTAHPMNKVYDALVIKQAPADWGSGVWHTATPSDKDFSGVKENIAKHGLRFRLTYDATALTLSADVTDDFLFPSNEAANKGSMVDGLEVYLDGRNGSRIGHGAYEKGVYQVIVYPGTPGTHPPFYSCSQGIDGLTLASERTDKGYRIVARIPFASFCVEPGTPRKIAFDIGVNSADTSGARIGQFLFAGNGNNWRDASNFVNVLLM